MSGFPVAVWQALRLGPQLGQAGFTALRVRGLTEAVSVTEGHGSAHCREEEIPPQLEAGGQLDKLLFASAWLLHFRERKKKKAGVYDKN